MTNIMLVRQPRWNIRRKTMRPEELFYCRPCDTGTCRGHNGPLGCLEIVVDPITGTDWVCLCDEQKAH